MIFLSFIFIFNKSNSYIVIPFKTFKTNDSKKSINIAENFLHSNLNNTIYIEIEAGIPSQKIPALILSEEFGFYITNHNCLIPSSFDNIEKSSTFWKSEFFKENTFNLPIQADISFGNDFFEFPTESSTRKQALLNFMYSPNIKKKNNIKKEENNLNGDDNDDINKYTCAAIGIRGAQYYGKDYEKNLVNQLFNKNIISNNFFSILYSSEDEGTFLIGAEPHKHDKKQYFENQLRYINSEENNNLFWSIHPSEIYFTMKNKIYNITNNLLCTLEYNLGVIYGTESYLNIIKEKYFNKLILENKCHEEIVHSVYTIFFCNNKNDIENFPSLNFYLHQILFTFSLDYNDLFYEKDGKYFFRIIFDRNNKIQWKLGKPFLKKYIFVFDYDSKKIGIYNDNLSKGNKIKNITYILLNILVIIGISFICYLGYYYGTSVYNTAINEKEEEYEYKYKAREERTKAYLYIEMMVESKVLEE